jgi:dTDP-glucose pyrophosphorylase
MTSDSDNRSPSLAWRRASLRLDATLQDAIRSLDESALQIVLIVDAGGALIGTLTDGDIRRGLLQGLTIDSPIATVVERNALVVPPGLGRETILQFMQAHKVHQLPVVDEQRRVIGLHRWDDLIAPVVRPNLVVIMAGGRGTRLRPHTDDCPKPLLPVAGRPLLEHIIEGASREGFRRFVISVHYLGSKIEAHVGDGRQWGVDVDYIREESPLGTAGGLSLLTPPDEPLIVTNGDILADVRYGALLDSHVRHQAAGTMAVRLHEWQHPFGVVHTRGVDIVGFEEKPVARTHVNAGIYVLSPAALGVLTRGAACDMPALFERLQARGERTIVYPMHEPWLDVGRPDDYQEAGR